MNETNEVLFIIKEDTKVDVQVYIEDCNNKTVTIRIKLDSKSWIMDRGTYVLNKGESATLQGLTLEVDEEQAGKIQRMRDNE